MLRASIISLFYLGILALAAAGEASESSYIYRRSRPPLAIVRFANANAARALWQMPLPRRFLELVRLADKDISLESLWRCFGFLAPFSADTFGRALDECQARDLHLFILPPARQPWQGALLFRTTVSAKDFLAKAAGASAVLEGKVSCLAADGWLCLTTAAVAEEPWMSGTAPLWTKTAKWRKALDTFLAQPCDGIACWLDGAWALETISYFARTEDSLALRLTTSGFLTPPAFTLRLRQSEATNRWWLAIGEEGREISASTTDAHWPMDAPILVGLRLEALRSVSAKHDAWDALLRIFAIADPSLATGLASQGDAIQMLTGCHPRVFFAMLANTLWLAVWEVGNEIEWAVICDLRNQSDAQLWLRRSLAWATFLGEKTGAWVAAECAADGQAQWMGKLSHPYNAVFRLYPGRLVIANSVRRADLAAASPASLPPANTGELLCWQAHWSPLLRLRVAPALGSFGALSQMLAEEKGILCLGKDAIYLMSEGQTSPLSLFVAAASGGWACGGDDEEEMACTWLRSLLAAQQVYRHLGLAAFNGGHGYAPDLRLLADGKAENGNPLAEMFDRLYAASDTMASGDEPLRFSVIVRTLASAESEGGYFCGYRFLQPRQRGNRPVNWEAEWFMMAWPWRTESRPALLIDQNGCLYRRRIIPGEKPEDLANLPENLTAAGWQKR